MWRQIYLILVICYASAIKVPVDNQDSATEIQKDFQEAQSTPVLYLSEDPNVDSYLLPPDPHKPLEALPDSIITPATYLVPPSSDKQTEFYLPIQPNVQSDWLPILQAAPQNNRNARFQRPQQEPIPIFLNLNQPGPSNQPLNIPPVPATHLVPPAIDAVSEFLLPDEEEPSYVDEHNEPINPFNVQEEEAINHGHHLVKQHLKSAEPTLTLHLTPPREQTLKSPTKLYPKKYAGAFKPVPIPLTQFDEEHLAETPKAKPVKYFKPQPHPEEVSPIPLDEKKLYKYRKAEHQRKLKQQEENVKQYESDGATEETHGGPTLSEQQTSETNLRYPGRNSYPAPLRQPPPTAPPLNSHPVGPAPDGRTEFRMHGMKGPHSYQFGYDTGKGKNRQFRYEERDNEGIVSGHYGYMDKHGKMRVVNYSAHPEYGFRAEEPKEEKE